MFSLIGQKNPPDIKFFFLLIKTKTGLLTFLPSQQVIQSAYSIQDATQEALTSCENNRHHVVYLCGFISSNVISLLPDIDKLICILKAQVGKKENFKELYEEIKSRVTQHF